ncbi:MAG: hypothetical protein EON93_19595 [Burkholderiales bacterium]|nr:MAG: hypothetical protein EON93_19595 [Burkholderiales bacterium]
MKRMLFAGLLLAGCSTTATPKDIELTNAGVMLGIEACHRVVLDGAPLDQAVEEAARGRKHERYASTIRGANLQAPNWKLDGLVWVGLNAQGNCEIFGLSGSGPTARDLVVSTHLGMSSRRWARMQVVAAPAGETRDGVCTTDNVGAGRSVGMVMTSRVDSNITLARTFVATFIKTDAQSCTSRQIP